MTKMPPAGYPAFLQYLQSGRVRKFKPRTYYVHEESRDVHSVGKVRLFQPFECGYMSTRC